MMDCGLRRNDSGTPCRVPGRIAIPLKAFEHPCAKSSNTIKLAEI